MSAETSLASMSPGDLARVVSISGDDPIAVRILEMGLTPGCQVRVIGAAPLGDPIEIEIRNYRLSLRRAEARRVEVKLEIDRTDS